MGGAPAAPLSVGAAFNHDRGLTIGILDFKRRIRGEF